MQPSRRILVVDDDDAISEFLDMALKDEGYSVVMASHGAAALDLIAQDGAPALILLDMRMPVMDGWGFAKEYRLRDGPHAPIVVLTAAADAARSAEQVHADAFLAKPFDLADLLAIVARYVHPS